MRATLGSLTATSTTCPSDETPSRMDREGTPTRAAHRLDTEAPPTATENVS